MNVTTVLAVLTALVVQASWYTAVYDPRKPFQTLWTITTILTASMITLAAILTFVEAPYL